MESPRTTSALPTLENRLQQRSSSKPIKLIVADDHVVVREGLIALLDDQADFRVLGQASTGKEALEIMCRLKPDVAVLDITMPDMTGLEAAHLIVTRQPGIKTLILTMHEQKDFFLEALCAGASGYVLKGTSCNRLFDAIRAIHAGGFYLPPEMAGELVYNYVNQMCDPTADDALTPREREIMILIAQGLTNRGIAERLTLSVNTVKTHRTHVYQKLNLRDRASVVNYALQHGLLRP